MQISGFQTFLQKSIHHAEIAQRVAKVKQTRVGAFFATPRNAIMALEFMLVIACAYQVSNVFWAVATPSEFRQADKLASQAVISRPYQPPQSLRVTTENLFRPLEMAGGSAAVGASAPVTTLNLQLFGVRSGGGTGRGSAIIRKPDNTQDVFFVGQDIIDGVALERIAPDHVVIRRMGVLESLYLDQARGAAASTASSTPPQLQKDPLPDGELVKTDTDIPRRRISASPSELFAALQVMPATTTSGVVGLSVRPRGDVSLFNDAGFLPGDVLIAVNGQGLTDVARVPQLIEGLAASRSFIVELDRGGSKLTQRFIVDR